MIRRRDNPNIFITQTAHAWVAGQFAALWGNEQFHIPALPNDLIMAAMNHDNGWIEWEQHPTLDDQLRPKDFFDMTATEHLDIWRQGIYHMIPQNQYAALLVSLHGRRLLEARYQQTDRGDSLEDKAALLEFTTQLKVVEAQIKERLRTKTHFQKACDALYLQANSQLLQLFDILSLVICMDKIGTETVGNVPGRSPDERVEVQIEPLNDDGMTIRPWPFKQPSFEIAVQMHHLPQPTFEDQPALLNAWQDAQIKTKIFTIQKSSFITHN